MKEPLEEEREWQRGRWGSEHRKRLVKRHFTAEAAADWDDVTDRLGGEGALSHSNIWLELSGWVSSPLESACKEVHTVHLHNWKLSKLLEFRQRDTPAAPPAELLCCGAGRGCIICMLFSCWSHPRSVARPVCEAWIDFHFYCQNPTTHNHGKKYDSHPPPPTTMTCSI